MREIKFRAWYDKSQTWVYIFIGQIMTTEGRRIYDEMCIDGVKWYQYTGLKDKNGKEIYEGDIVHYRYNVDLKAGGWSSDSDYVISWQSTGFHMQPLPGQGGMNGWLVSIPGLYGSDDKEAYGPNELLEIIGNIYENPELLK